MVLAVKGTHRVPERTPHCASSVGIAAIANSHVFTANAHYVFGSLNLGWITLILGALQLLAAAGVMAGNQRPAGSPWPCSG